MVFIQTFANYIDMDMFVYYTIFNQNIYVEGAYTSSIK